MKRARRCGKLPFTMQQAPTAPTAPPAPAPAPAPGDGGPELRLDVDGKRLVAACVTVGPAGSATHRFSVGPGAALVRMVSRTAVPAAGETGSADRRRLGVAVRRIRLRGRRLELDLPHDDPSLAEGFHPAEPGHRWTDGAGVIPPQWLRALQEGFDVEIEISESGLRYTGGG